MPYLKVRNNDRGLALPWIASAISFSCLLLRSLAASNDRSNSWLPDTSDVVGYPAFLDVCIYVYHPTKELE
ncbi:hypothetical protein EDC04DRAFT_2825345 [Pisolithus marmoratus]|nr:hypothetical protein EDC04DRAFT_2825345 [Pisolithus marmoratus]